MEVKNNYPSRSTKVRKDTDDSLLERKGMAMSDSSKA
jgi:hypothetical protein